MESFHYSEIGKKTNEEKLQGASSPCELISVGRPSLFHAQRTLHSNYI